MRFRSTGTAGGADCGGDKSGICFIAIGGFRKYRIAIDDSEVVRAVFCSVSVKLRLI